MFVRRKYHWFVFRDIPIWIVCRKFGLEETIRTAANDFERISDAMPASISRAVKMFEEILHPQIDSLVRSGHFITHNYHRRLRARYSFFRAKAVIAFISAGWDISTDLMEMVN